MTKSAVFLSIIMFLFVWQTSKAASVTDFVSSFTDSGVFKVGATARNINNTINDTEADQNTSGSSMAVNAFASGEGFSASAFASSGASWGVFSDPEKISGATWRLSFQQTANTSATGSSQNGIYTGAGSSSLSNQYGAFFTLEKAASYKFNVSSTGAAHSASLKIPL